MKWQCNFSVGSKSFKTEAEIICTTHQIEQISITGNGIAVVLQNNRPLLTAIELKRPLTWRQVSGDMRDQAVLNTIIQKLEQHFSLTGGKLTQSPVAVIA